MQQEIDKLKNENNELQKTITSLHQQISDMESKYNQMVLIYKQRLLHLQNQLNKDESSIPNDIIKENDETIPYVLSNTGVIDLSNSLPTLHNSLDKTIRINTTDENVHIHSDSNSITVTLNDLKEYEWIGLYEAYDYINQNFISFQMATKQRKHCFNHLHDGVYDIRIFRDKTHGYLNHSNNTVTLGKVHDISIQKKDNMLCVDQLLNTNQFILRNESNSYFFQSELNVDDISSGKYILYALNVITDSVPHTISSTIKQLQRNCFSNDVATIPAPFIEFLNGISNESYGETSTLLTSSVRITSIQHTKSTTSVILPLDFCKYAKLEQLIIDGIKCIVDLTPGNLKEDLKVFSLINSTMTSISETLMLHPEESWKKLKRLTLSGCQLKKIPSKVFNQTNFPHLEYLDLSHNNISVIENITDRPLDTLIIADNNITKIKLRGVGSLSTLNMDNNMIENISNLSTIFSLTSLSIRNNKIYDSRHFENTFEKMFSLSEVCFSGNPFSLQEKYRENLAATLPAFQFGLDIIIDTKPLKTIEKTAAIVALQQKSSVYEGSDVHDIISDDIDDLDDEKVNLGKLVLHDDDITEKETRVESEEDISDADVFRFIQDKVTKEDQTFLQMIRRLVKIDNFEKWSGDIDSNKIQQAVTNGQFVEIDKSTNKTDGKLKLVVNSEDVTKVLEVFNTQPKDISNIEEPEIIDNTATTEDLEGLLKDFKMGY
ncbi:Protein-serine/threonine phosphatase [Entamoeba marina]